VQICFQTNCPARQGPETGNSEDMELSRALPRLKDIVLTEWTVKNNGDIFREEDWNRLKKIGGSSPSGPLLSLCYEFTSITDLWERVHS
jgi:hypothetical protein